MLFKNPKGLQIMGKGGEIASPLPSRRTIKSLIETEEKTGDVGDSLLRRLPTGTIVEEELLLPVMELLEVAIEAGKVRVWRD